MIIESKVRFSESILWRLQEAAYRQYGQKAWSERGVPSYLTSNPYIANQYAQVVLGFIRDCLSPRAATSLNVGAPLYIFDLGAGTGRFGYLFLKALLPFLGAIFSQNIQIRYVMTDIVPENIAFWQQHPYLKPYIDSGILDFAIYEAEQNAPLMLLQSRKTLHPGKVINPCILIGNYFFDTIRQDLFRVRNNVLQEGFLTLSIKGDEELGPEIIPKLDCTYDYEPVKSLKTYYGDFPELNKLLSTYCEMFNQTTFLLPVGALRSIRYFSELTNGRLLLLAGDQGVSSEQQVRDWGEPKIARHGSFSVPVSYHALRLYFEQQGGVGLLTGNPDLLFVVIAAVLGGGCSYFSKTIQAFRETIDAFEPKDYWKLVSNAVAADPKPTLEQILFLIKFGRWDPVNFHTFFEMIRKELPGASSKEKLQIVYAIDRVWEQFYPTHKGEGEIVLNFGVLLFEMGEYEKALEYFKKSMEITGASSKAYKNMAACFNALGDPRSAFDCERRASVARE